MNSFPIDIVSRGSEVRVRTPYELVGVMVEADGKWRDGGTVPRLFWAKWHPMSDPLPCFLLHDQLIDPDYAEGDEIDYGYARDKFKEALAHPQMELPKWEQRTIYYGVRLKDWQRRVTARFIRAFHRKFKTKNGR